MHDLALPGGPAWRDRDAGAEAGSAPAAGPAAGPAVRRAPVRQSDRFVRQYPTVSIPTVRQLLGCNRHCCQLLLMVRPAALLPTVANDPVYCLRQLRQQSTGCEKHL